MRHGIGATLGYSVVRAALQCAVALSANRSPRPRLRAVKAVVDGLLNAQRVPEEKYAQPITSSQEVGWLSKPLVASNPRFQHGLKQAEATQFAETYTKKMAGEHMFHGKSGKYLKF